MIFQKSYFQAVCSKILFNGPGLECAPTFVLKACVLQHGPKRTPSKHVCSPDRLYAPRNRHERENKVTQHSSVLELRKNQFLKKIFVLKTFLEIETTHYLEGLDLKLNNETYAKVPNL